MNGDESYFFHCVKFSRNMKCDKLLVYCLLLVFCGGLAFLLSNHNMRKLLLTGKSLTVLSVMLLFIIY